MNNLEETAIIILEDIQFNLKRLSQQGYNVKTYSELNKKDLRLIFLEKPMFQLIISNCRFYNEIIESFDLIFNFGNWDIKDFEIVAKATCKTYNDLKALVKIRDDIRDILSKKLN